MEPTKARIEDVVSYQPKDYITQDEKNLIRYHFKGNDKLLNIIRKVFLPTIQDPELPLEQFGKDLWMGQLDFSQMSVNEVKAITMARQDLVKQVFGGLIYIKSLAHEKVETEAEEKERRKKDSTK